MTEADYLKMPETDYALLLANKILDRINADPDDDLAVLARQFLRAHEARDLLKEKVAHWMIEHSFATGHGDTMDDLLAELSRQVDAKLDQRR
jgi:hypothetical protein